MPRFCISVPVGAWHPLLEQCLASLAAQDADLEVALLDASGDARVRVLADKYADLLTYRHHGPDDGQADAIASGWEHTEGDVLGWLNADDVLAPGALKHAADAFAANPDAAIVYGLSTICDDYGRVTGYHWNVRPTADDIMSTCSISQPSCFFRRDALDAIGGLDRALHYTMDWDLWIRFHMAGYRFAFINEVMSLVLWTAEAKTGGFGAGRRRELRRLLDMNPDKASRRAGYIGFITHHLYEYLLPKALRRWIWRRDVSGGAGMFGWTVSGDIQSDMQVPLFHYTEGGTQEIVLWSDADAQSVSVVANGVECQQSGAEEGRIIFNLPAPVPPASVLKLQVRNRGNTALCVQGISLSSQSVVG